MLYDDVCSVEVDWHFLLFSESTVRPPRAITSVPDLGEAPLLPFPLFTPYSRVSRAPLTSLPLLPPPLSRYDLDVPPSPFSLSRSKVGMRPTPRLYRFGSSFHEQFFGRALCCFSVPIDQGCPLCPVSRDQACLCAARRGYFPPLDPWCPHR